MSKKKSSIDAISHRLKVVPIPEHSVLMKKRESSDGSIPRNNSSIHSSNHFQIATPSADSKLDVYRQPKIARKNKQKPLHKER